MAVRKDFSGPNASLDAGLPADLMRDTAAKDPTALGRRRNRGREEMKHDRLCGDPNQPRTVFDAEALQELAISIRAQGMLSPIRVRWHEGEGKWMIIAGERRWRAAKLAGLEWVPVWVVEGELTEQQILGEQLTENLQRVGLNGVDAARKIEKYMQMAGCTASQLRDLVGFDKSYVSRTLRLLRLSQPVQELVLGGKLASRTAYELTKLEEPAAQEDLARQAIENRWTVEDTARAIKSLKRPSQLSRREEGAGQGEAPRGTRIEITVARGAKVTVWVPWSPITDADQRAALESALQLLTKPVTLHVAA